MDNVDISAFVAVADTGSIKSAAQNLYVSESTISRRVRSLENDLGIELLARSRKGTTLTAEGRELIESARRVVDASGQLTSLAQTLSAQVHPALRVGYIGWSYEELALVLAAKAAERRFPTLEVDFIMDKTSGIVDKLREGELDAALLFNDSLPEFHPYRTQEVGASKPIAILPAEHPLAHRASVTMADLANETFLYDAPRPGAVWDDQFRTQLRVLGASNCEVRSVGSYKSIPALVAAGQGIGIANQWMTNPFPKFITYVPIEENRFVTRVDFVWRTDTDTALATVFADELTAALASLC